MSVRIRVWTDPGHVVHYKSLVFTSTPSEIEVSDEDAANIVSAQTASRHLHVELIESTPAQTETPPPAPKKRGRKPRNK
jgi:hypothetical protein